VKYLLQSNVSPSQFAIELQNTKAYQQRFAANQDRIKAGLRALTPAEYVGLEDQYQNIMRNYGLPATYYSKDAIGTQAGFQKLLANDVSASELEDRIATAQQRVLNTNPEVLRALRQFYPDLSNADILAYTLDPQNALANIKRKVSCC
jgi:ABC-type Zn2+ transport system substrate-binding protein/surface adhesin